MQCKQKDKISKKRLQKNNCKGFIFKALSKILSGLPYAQKFLEISQNSPLVEKLMTDLFFTLANFFIRFTVNLMWQTCPPIYLPGLPLHNSKNYGWPKYEEKNIFIIS